MWEDLYSITSTAKNNKGKLLVVVISQICTYAKSHQITGGMYLMKVMCQEDWGYKNM
jgi:hypothetical protein